VAAQKSSRPTLVATGKNGEQGRALLRGATRTGEQIDDHLTRSGIGEPVLDLRTSVDDIVERFDQDHDRTYRVSSASGATAACPRGKYGRVAASAVMA